MISLLEIAHSMNEADVDDDKIIKYKDKEGESQEMTAGAAKKQPDDHPAKVAYNKMADDGGDDKKDSGGKLGGGDFDRDANRAADDDADDMDRDARFDAEDDEDEFSGPNPDDDKNLEDAEETVAYYEDELNHHQERLQSAQNVLDDALEDPENAKDDIKRAKKLLAKSTRGIKFNTNKLKDANEKVKSFSGRAADDEADDMDRDARFDADSADEDDAEEISDSNSGPIDTDDIKDMLMKDSDIVDKMGDDVYFDGEDLVSSKFDDDTIGSVRGNMTLGDLKKQIMDYEEEQDESIKVIDGKKYKAIKESKKNPRILKEIYDRTFRSLK